MVTPKHRMGQRKDVKGAAWRKRQLGALRETKEKLAAAEARVRVLEATVAVAQQQERELAQWSERMGFSPTHLRMIQLLQELQQCTVVVGDNTAREQPVLQAALACADAFAKLNPAALAEHRCGKELEVLLKAVQGYRDADR